MSKNNGKPFYKKWWFILIVVLLILGIFGKLTGKDKPSTNAETTSITEKADDSTKSDKITIDTTSLGEYGKELTFKGIDYKNNSAAVEMKENGYFIPSGRYKVALTKGDKAVTLTVFSGEYNEQKDSDGNIYEENADITNCIVLFNGEEAKDIEIPDGFCVKTSDNAKCILEFTTVE